MTRLIATTDLHQHPAKWKLLASAIIEQKPDVVLIAGDLLPKYDGFVKQREYFPELRRLLTKVRDDAGAQVLLYLSNDDAHYVTMAISDGLEVANVHHSIFGPPHSE